MSVHQVGGFNLDYFSFTIRLCVWDFICQKHLNEMEQTSLISTEFYGHMKIKIYWLFFFFLHTAPGILIAKKKEKKRLLNVLAQSWRAQYNDLISLKKSGNWPAGALTAAVLPALGTMKRDWMKEPRALTMSLNTLVECCFMSYDWQKELKKGKKTHKWSATKKLQETFWPSTELYYEKCNLRHLRLCLSQVQLCCQA